VPFGFTYFLSNGRDRGLIERKRRKRRNIEKKKLFRNKLSYDRYYDLKLTIYTYFSKSRISDSVYGIFWSLLGKHFRAFEILLTTKFFGSGIVVSRKALPIIGCLNDFLRQPRCTLSTVHKLSFVGEGDDVFWNAPDFRRRTDASSPRIVPFLCLLNWYSFHPQRCFWYYMHSKLKYIFFSSFIKRAENYLRFEYYWIIRRALITLSLRNRCALIQLIVVVWSNQTG
jgi:hypothetical protein